MYNQWSKKRRQESFSGNKGSHERGHNTFHFWVILKTKYVFQGIIGTFEIGKRKSCEGYFSEGLSVDKRTLKIGFWVSGYETTILFENTQYSQIKFGNA